MSAVSVVEDRPNFHLQSDTLPGILAKTTLSTISGRVRSRLILMYLDLGISSVAVHDAVHQLYDTEHELRMLGAYDRDVDRDADRSVLACA